MAKAYKFDSGLTLLYEKNNINKATHLSLDFDCGARCDGEIPGLAHFCEHMFFTETDKLNKQEVLKRYFDFIQVNAFTTSHDIAFVGSIETERLEDYLLTVQDMICNSTFSPEAVAREQNVVIQEIVRDADKHWRHSARLKRYELYNQQHFKDGALGTAETVGSITSADVKNYIKKYFVKNNCVIQICTPLSFNKVKNIIKKNFEQGLPSNKLKPLPYEQDKLTDTEVVSVNYKDIDKNFLSVIFKSEKHGPDLKYHAIMGLICNMISDVSDGLTKELRVDKGLVSGLSAGNMVNKVSSYIELHTEIIAENIKPCLDVEVDYIKRLLETGFSKEQFAKELEKDEYYWETRVENPKVIKDNLQKYRYYNEFYSDKDMHDMVQSLTLDEVNETMRDIFTNSKLHVFVYGNADKKDVYTLAQMKKKLGRK